MPITPFNQSKNTVSPSGQVKSYLTQAVYGVGRYGVAIYGIGISGIASMVNQTKSSLASYLELQDGTSFLLQDGGTLEMQGGAGALVYINQSKS